MPCHHAGLPPLVTDGLTKGGAVHAGRPFFTRNVGCMPLLELLKLCVSVKPMLCVDPVTVVIAA